MVYITNLDSLDENAMYAINNALNVLKFGKIVHVSILIALIIPSNYRMNL